MHDNTIYENQEMINQFYDLTLELLCIVNTNGIFIKLNPVWESTLGYKLDELEGKKFLDFVHPNDLEQTNDAFNDIANNKNVPNFANRFKHKDGSYKYLEWKYFQKGELIYAVAHDITREKITELTLKKQIAVNKVLTELSQEIISSDLSIEKIAQKVFDACIIFTSSTIGYVSIVDSDKKNNCLLMYTKEILNRKEFKNQKCFKIDDNNQTTIWNIPLKLMQSILSNSFNKDEESHFGVNLPTDLNNFLSVPAIINKELVGQISLANSPIDYTNEDLDIIEKLANIYSIAIYKKKAEQDLIKAKEKAVESDNLKSAFLANVSHEIRTPMNGIIGFSEFLKEPDITHEKRNYFINIINDSCSQLLKIVNDILDISKIETKQITINKEQVDINSLIHELYNYFKPIISKSNISLHVYNGLPDTSSLIISDSQKLRQIFNNLISNSIKFTKNGYVEFGYKIIEDKIEFYVKDTGIGIKPEMQTKVFERFMQADVSLTRKFGGTGLGLSIAKGYSELLGGKIWLESEYGKGSTFYFSIPFEPVCEDLQLNDFFSNEIIQQNGNLSKFSLLVVEDEEINYLFVHQVLISTGLKLAHAKNGKEAVELFSLKHFDLVLMDIKMPIMNGYEATILIKKDHPNAKIIAFTAYAMEQDRIKAIESGCIDYISKPVDKTKLLNTIKTHLKQA